MCASNLIITTPLPNLINYNKQTITITITILTTMKQSYKTIIPLIGTNHVTIINQIIATKEKSEILQFIIYNLKQLHLKML